MNNQQAQPISSPPKLGNKVNCKRPGTLLLCVQVTNVDNGKGMFKKELNLDFVEMTDKIPDYKNKKTLRLNKGEIAHLIGCVLGYIEKAGAGYRESGLSVMFVTKDKERYITLYDKGTKQNYIKLQSSEMFQIYQLCLECLKDEGQSTQDVIYEIKAFFNSFNQSGPTGC